MICVYAEKWLKRHKNVEIWLDFVSKCTYNYQNLPVKLYRITKVRSVNLWFRQVKKITAYHTIFYKCNKKLIDSFREA